MDVRTWWWVRPRWTNGPRLVLHLARSLPSHLERRGSMDHGEGQDGDNKDVEGTSGTVASPLAGWTTPPPSRIHRAWQPGLDNQGGQGSPEHPSRGMGDPRNSRRNDREHGVVCLFTPRWNHGSVLGRCHKARKTSTDRTRILRGRKGSWRERDAVPIRPLKPKQAGRRLR